MQTGLQFFDMPIKGLESGQTQKIAIKMAGQSSDKSTIDDGFMAIMDTLMALSPEQLQTSLKQLEWVPVEEGVETFAPLIDLSQMDSAMESGAKHVLELLVNSEGKDVWPLTNRPDVVLSKTPGYTPPVGPTTVENGTLLFATENKTPELALQVPLESVKGNKLAFEPVNQFSSEKETGAQNAVKPSTDSGTWEKLNAANIGRDGKQNVVGVQNDKMGSEPAKDVFHAVQAKDTFQAIPAKDVFRAVDPIQFNRPLNSTDLSAGTMNHTQEMPISDDLSKQMVGSKADQKISPIKTDQRASVAEFKNVPLEMDDHRSAAIKNNHVKINDKPAVMMKSEQFKAVSDAITTGSDKGLNVINQMNEPALKETVRHNVQVASHKTDMENGDIKFNKVQPNSSAKDASLSFSSRWGAMAEKNTEMVTDAKSMDAAPDRTEQNDVIRQIVQRMTLKNSRLQSQMNIKLKPEFLGNIRMQITSDNQQIAVRMVADSSAVKEIIEQNIQYLKAELQQHGLEIDKFDVFVGEDGDELRHEKQAQLWERSRNKGQELKQNSEDTKDSEDSQKKDQQNDKRTTAHDSEIDYFA